MDNKNKGRGTCMKELTKKQREIYDYIKETLASTKRPPTIAEIKNHFNFVSNQSVVDHIKALTKKGYVEKVGKSRGIIPTKKEVQIPILGQVAAGNPIEAIESNHEDCFNLDEYVNDPGRTYVLKIKGDSMKNAGIMDGDYVFVRYQQELKNGEIGVAVIDEEATVKRFQFENGKCILYPENEEFQPMEIMTNNDNFRIAGKVIGVFRSLS